MATSVSIVRCIASSPNTRAANSVQSSATSANARATRSAHTRRTVATLAALATAATAAVFAAPAASAHDAVMSSNPEEGSTVIQFPTQLELTMSAEPKAQFNTIALSEKSTGTILASGTPTIDKNVLTFTLPTDLHPTAGIYTVGFQITSSDGHATRGSFDFTFSGDGTAGDTAAVDDPGAEASTAGSSGAAATSAQAGSAKSSGVSDAAQADTTSSSTGWVWWGGAAAVIVLIGGIAYALRRRSRRG